LQQHEPFLVVERAFMSEARCVRRESLGLRQGPMTRAAAMALLRSRELQVAAQVQLPGGDGLIDVAADGVHLARWRLDIRNHLAMGTADRTRGGVAGEFRSDALPHRPLANVGERGLALFANQIAYAR